MVESVRLPLVEQISFSDAINFSNALDHYEDVVFFHSARSHDKLSRYSFVAFDPFKKSTCPYDHSVIPYLDELKNIFEEYRLSALPDLPPFQGGIAGYISYDAARDLENLPNYAAIDIPYPKLVLGFYDIVVAIDHLKQQAWVFSSGLPEFDVAKNQHRKQTRMHWALLQIKNAQPILPCEFMLNEDKIESNFSKSQYLDAIKKAIRYIIEGDIFQVNLSQRFKCSMPRGLTAFQLYKRISALNSAPFASYIRFNDLCIVSSSPERFIQVRNGDVETRPIKGTMERSKNKLEDEVLARKLQNSEKDRAENAMIVDLMRNDLSKVCLPHSVEVTQFCHLESYENVHHLVSVINGKLNPNYNNIDLLHATIPGGSITGAPKIRAMEIIDELEPTRRGPYCGNAVYIGFDGCMDSSILIRTYVISNNCITFQTGGAIVLDSNPEQEYQETLVKAQKLKEALINEWTGP